MIKLFIGELSIFLKDGIATKDEILKAWSKAVNEYKNVYEIYSSEKLAIKNQTRESFKN